MLDFRSEAFHIKVHAPKNEAADEMLTTDALRFVGLLCHLFEGRRQELLQARQTLADCFDMGKSPHYLKAEEQPKGFSDPSWQCAPVPDDVKDRRVEITGPVDRKMVINGLNSGANVYMADFEDSTSPTWSNLVEGQYNLRDAVNGTISYTDPKRGKVYSLKGNPSVLFVRPRGWHLNEAHVTVNGNVISGALFDFALYLFHNHQALLNKGTRPYFYLPKLENHLEARLWNDVFVVAQQYLGLELGTIRATVLLETITASFQMEEILFELKEHSLGLNCGRWDYLFSYIKKFKLHPSKITPDRVHLTMTTPLMDSYVKRLIYICHKRGTFAMGGMSASIPIKNDPVRNDAAMKKVEDDKLREVSAGHDGTWVAHPALVTVAKNVFTDYFQKNHILHNQINNSAGTTVGGAVTQDDLMELPTIPYGQAITSAGLQRGISIVLQYTEAWLRGVGCIPLHNAMEDAATAEISRAQIWQWIQHNVQTQDDETYITKERVSRLVQDEVNHQCGGIHAAKGRFRLAGNIVKKMLTNDKLDDFLTTVCYPYIVTNHQLPASSRL